MLTQLFISCVYFDLCLCASLSKCHFRQYLSYHTCNCTILVLFECYIKTRHNCFTKLKFKKFIIIINLKWWTSILKFKLSNCSHSFNALAMFAAMVAEFLFEDPPLFKSCIDSLMMSSCRIHHFLCTSFLASNGVSTV